MKEYNPLCLWCNVEIFKVREVSPMIKGRRNLKFCGRPHEKKYHNKRKADRRAWNKLHYKPKCLSCEKDLLSHYRLKREEITYDRLMKLKYCSDTCRGKHEDKVPGLENTPPPCISQHDFMNPYAKVEDLFKKIVNGKAHYVG